MLNTVADVAGSASCARIFCIGNDARHLLEICCDLDSEYDVVIAACPDEGLRALALEAPFDVIISDPQMTGAYSRAFYARLRAHSPDAERILLTPQMTRAMQKLAARDSRVMRLLVTPCPPSVLSEAVEDALLRHRARELRATTLPRVTPMGGHPCCAYARVR